MSGRGWSATPDNRQPRFQVVRDRIAQQWDPNRGSSPRLGGFREGLLEKVASKPRREDRPVEWRWQGQPSTVEDEMGSGQGPDKEGSWEEGQEADLDTESKRGVKARWLLCEQGHWLGRMAGRKQGWEQPDRWKAAAVTRGAGGAEGGGKCRTRRDSAGMGPELEDRLMDTGDEGG